LEAREETQMFKILNLIKIIGKNTTKTMVMKQVEDRHNTNRKTRRTSSLLLSILYMMIKMLRKKRKY